MKLENHIILHWNSKERGKKLIFVISHLHYPTIKCGVNILGRNTWVFFAREYAFNKNHATETFINCSPSCYSNSGSYCAILLRRL
jgi:hypothetical protein